MSAVDARELERLNERVRALELQNAAAEAEAERERTLRAEAEAKAERERTLRTEAEAKAGAARAEADAARVTAEAEAERERTLRAEAEAKAGAARAEADAARVAAEAEAERERTLRAEAEAKAERESMLRAESDAARVAAEEEARRHQASRFFAEMRGMSGSASEHAAVSADVARRGAPAPELVSAEALLDGMAAASQAAVQAAWDVCRGKLSARPAVSVADLGQLAERTSVHPLVWLLLEAAALPLGGEACTLRLWREQSADDSVPHARAVPDVLCTHPRDATPSSLGTCFGVEIKRWSDAELDMGCAQGGNYGRRLVARRSMELLERGDELSAVAVLVAASNGADVVFLRVRSGVRAGEEPFGGTPCPTEQAPPLPLLRGWNPADPTVVPLKPPAGFTALWRVLHTEPALLNGCTQPLESITVDAPPLFSGELQLGMRLGCGGSSDVYACTLPDGASAAVKVARAATSRVNEWFDKEQANLERLRTAQPGAVPVLLGAGSRELPARASVLSRNSLAAPWRLLFLSPAGVPLSAALEEHLQRAAAVRNAAAPGELRRARRAFGDIVAAGVLRGLGAAHAAGIIHCDVRPGNVVFVDEPRSGGAVLLVDYGLSRKPRSPVSGVGVRAYAADCVFLQSSCAARAGLDLVAAAYTWLSVVYGDAACRAPWVVCGETAAAWLARQALRDADVARIAAATALLVRPEYNARIDARWYTWPWPDMAEAAVDTRPQSPS